MGLGDGGRARPDSSLPERASRPPLSCCQDVSSSAVLANVAYARHFGAAPRFDFVGPLGWYTREMDERQSKVARSRLTPYVFGLMVVVSVVWLALWVVSLVRHNTDWFLLAIAVVFGLVASYYGWLIRNRPVSADSSSV
jgi:hypothetical protein